MYTSSYSGKRKQRFILLAKCWCIIIYTFICKLCFDSS